MNIEIKVNTAKFEQALSDLPDAIARAQRVALNQIGNTVKNRAIDAFRQPQFSQGQFCNPFATELQ